MSTLRDGVGQDYSRNQALRTGRQTLGGDELCQNYYIGRGELPRGAPIIPQALFWTKCTNCGARIPVHDNSWICGRCGKWQNYADWITPDSFASR